MTLTLPRISAALAIAFLFGCSADDTGGESGAAGSSVSGAPGTNGGAGTMSSAGSSGAAGTTGNAGATGAAGTSASAGTNGRGGTTGAAGTTGAGGTSAGMTGGGAMGGSGGGGGGNAGHGGTGGGVAGRGGAGGGGAGRGGSGGGAAGGSGSGGVAGSYNPCPTNGDPCRILPVGDSITFGINQEGSYRIELFHKAVQAMQKITYTGTLQNGPQMVDNVPFPRRYEATSGITIDGLSTQITKNNTLAMPADIITVHIGTNDMYMSDPAGAPTRLGSLLDKLATGLPNALIVVAKIIPLKMSESSVTTFNNAIAGIVQTRVAAGKHIIIIDLNTGFPASDISSDNVHPNSAGYAWMGDRFYDLLGPLFPK